MDINQKIAQEVARDLRQKLPKFFNKIGGQRQKKPKLNVRWCLPADELTLWYKDVEEAVKTECAAEITQELYQSARCVAPVIETIAMSEGDLNEALTKFILRLITHANNLANQCVMIVSPTVLAMIRASGTNLFEQIGSDSPFVGTLGGHHIFIDTYASNDVPVLIMSPGWFSYKAGLFVYPDDEARAPITSDYMVSFYKDFEHKIDASKVIQVAFDRVREARGSEGIFPRLIFM